MLTVVLGPLMPEKGVECPCLVCIRVLQPGSGANSVLNASQYFENDEVEFHVKYQRNYNYKVIHVFSTL